MHSHLKKAFDKSEKSRQKLISLSQGLSDAQLNQPPARGGWTLVQVLYHLTLAEELTLQYLQKKVQAPEALKPTAIGTGLKSQLIFLGLELPLRFKAPQGVSSLPSPLDLQEVLSRWDKGREDFRAFLEAYPPELLDRAIWRHPSAGRMNMAQAVGFMNAHIRHHLRQAKRIRKEVSG